jgi:hypothetical protein
MFPLPAEISSFAACKKAHMKRRDVLSWMGLGAITGATVGLPFGGDLLAVTQDRASTGGSTFASSSE